MVCNIILQVKYSHQEIILSSHFAYIGQSFISSLYTNEDKLERDGAGDVIGIIQFSSAMLAVLLVVDVVNVVHMAYK